jgi:hypothetical protein
MSDTLELNCWIFGDEQCRIFGVEIQKTKTVDALKKKIKDEYQETFRHIDAFNLQLWKVRELLLQYR